MKPRCHPKPSSPLSSKAIIVVSTRHGYPRPRRVPEGILDHVQKYHSQHLRVPKHYRPCRASRRNYPRPPSQRLSSPQPRAKAILDPAFRLGPVARCHSQHLRVLKHYRPRRASRRNYPRPPSLRLSSPQPRAKAILTQLPAKAILTAAAHLSSPPPCAEAVLLGSYHRLSSPPSPI